MIMKKIIVSLVLLFTFTISQVKAEGFDVGLRLGYNSSLSFSSLNSNLSYNYKNVFSEFLDGLHVGVYGRFYFDKMYVQPELLYSRDKRNYTLTDDDGSYDNVVKLNLIDIPILVGYKIVDVNLFKIRAFVGPVFRINTGSSVDFKNLSSNINWEELKYDIKGARIGLQTGIGIDISFFSFDIRYNLIGSIYETSLADVKKEGFPPSTFIFSLGWKIF